MSYMNNKAAVFILLGQSNAVGHGIPMSEEDIITVPMKNVFGLTRKLNQSFDNNSLYWSGYTSFGMNLGEEQDNTYSVANCLAKLWQNKIDVEPELNLPDLYIVHIAIGAQGVTQDYMWYPWKDEKLVPGVLGKVDIALYSFTMHILSQVKKSIIELGKDPQIIGIHWRGGENDVTASDELLQVTLKKIYNFIFDGFCQALGERAPIVLHKIICPDRCLDMDSTGQQLKRMHYINRVFQELAINHKNFTVFDASRFPAYIPNIRGNGIFIEDAVHYTPEVNQWVAEEIFNKYKMCTL